MVLKIKMVMINDFPSFRIVIAGKYCIVVSRLKPGDRSQPMIIGYF